MWEAVPSGKVPQSCDRIWFPMPKKMCVSVCLGTQKLPQPWECLALQACWRMKILFEKSNKCLFVGPREFFGGEGMKNYPVSNGDCKKPWSKDPVPKQSFFPLLKEASLQAFSDLRSSTSCKITMKFTEMTWQKVWSSKAETRSVKFWGFFHPFFGGEEDWIQLWAFIGLVFLKAALTSHGPDGDIRRCFPRFLVGTTFGRKKRGPSLWTGKGALAPLCPPKKLSRLWWDGIGWDALAPRMLCKMTQHVFFKYLVKLQRPHTTSPQKVVEEGKSPYFREKIAGEIL